MSETPETNSRLLEKSYRTAAVAVAAEIFATLVLTLVAWFLISNSYNDISEQAITALWMTILLIAAGSFVLRRAFFSWERLKNVALLKGISGLFETLQMNTILLGLLGVIVAVLGFLVATLSGNKMEMLRAGAISLVVFLMNFPRKSVWQKVLVGAQKL